MKESMNNDKVFSKVDLTSGELVRVREGKGKFDKGNSKFTKELFEIHSREGYSYRVKDSDGDLKKRRYKPVEIQAVQNVQNLINRDRIKRDEKNEKTYKTTNALIRNEEMTRAEAKKALKKVESKALGPARSTRSQARTTRSQAKK
jgi:hypothetical protein